MGIKSVSLLIKSSQTDSSARQWIPETRSGIHEQEPNELQITVRDAAWPCLRHNMEPEGRVRKRVNLRSTCARVFNARGSLLPSTPRRWKEVEGARRKEVEEAWWKGVKGSGRNKEVEG